MNKKVGCLKWHGYFYMVLYMDHLYAKPFIEHIRVAYKVNP